MWCMPASYQNLKNSRNSRRFWNSQPTSIKMITQSQKQEDQFASFEDTAAQLPELFVAEAGGRSHRNRTRPIGNQTEKSRPRAIGRLCLAIVNRAILDVLENGKESREAERWLLSRDFDSLQAAFD